MVSVRLDGDESSQDSCFGPADVKRQYDIDEKVGEGAYGEVYRARTKSGDVPVALKRVKMESEGDWLPTTALREIAILKELHHPNIVSLNNVHICDDKSLYLEFEFVDMDLKKFMAQQPEVFHNPMNIKRVLYQILRAVNYCHERRILHRDLKPQNILVDGQSHKVKLADFGLARVVTLPARAYTHEVVTLWYRAPEILLGAKTYTTAVDTWSVGCIFAEMCNLGEPLFKGESEIAQLFSIFKGLGTPTEVTWPGVSNLTYMMEHLPQWSKADLRAQMPAMENDAWDLLTKMLIYPPFERISAEEALKHPYFKDLDIAQFDT